MAKSNGPRLGLMVALFAVVVLATFYISISTVPTGSTALQSAITPSPEVGSGQALKNLRATEDAMLTTYGWVDRDTGVVHIPIDRAMDLMLERGFPVREPRQ